MKLLSVQNQYTANAGECNPPARRQTSTKTLTKTFTKTITKTITKNLRLTLSRPTHTQPLMSSHSADDGPADDEPAAADGPAEPEDDGPAVDDEPEKNDEPAVRRCSRRAFFSATYFFMTARISPFLRVSGLRSLWSQRDGMVGWAG